MMEISKKIMLLRLEKIYGIIVNVCLLTIASKVRVPLGFVPMTMQTAALMFICLRSDMPATSVLSWIFIGLAGLPVFSGSISGIMYVYTPQFGYLLGFALSSVIANFIRKKVVSHFISCVIVDSIVFSVGLLWLYCFGLLISDTITFGLCPFIMAEALKISIVCALLKTEMYKI